MKLTVFADECNIRFFCNCGIGICKKQGRSSSILRLVFQNIFMPFYGDAKIANFFEAQKIPNPEYDCKKKNACRKCIEDSVAFEKKKPRENQYEYCIESPGELYES